MEDATVLSHELGSAIDRASSVIATSQLDGVIEQLKSIERNYISRAGDNPALAVETKRRIAEAIFLAAITKKSLFGLCENFFRELSRLGFSNSYQELSFHIIFARYCLASGWYGEGIRLLERFENVWKRADQADPNKPSKGDIRIVKSLLGKLRTAQKR